MSERRPRYRRPCPIHAETGCDWMQVTAWWRTPLESTEVPAAYLVLEAEAHLRDAHMLHAERVGRKLFL